MYDVLDPPLTTAAIAEIAGVTYRQIDWWVRLGLVRPAYRDANGSGSRRAWSIEQVRVLRVIGYLRSLGTSLDDAGRCAAELALLPRDYWTGHHIFDGRYVIDLAAMKEGT